MDNHQLACRHTLKQMDQLHLGILTARMVRHKQRTIGDQLVKLGFRAVTNLIPEKQALLLIAFHFLRPN
uniref:Uncharacterized protein n=1 Tax=Pseudomonas monteilii TaxID=76759 RepID=A0A6B7PVZ1_9PSED|nr:hypothetical protein [Pseudomonas monteilii]